MVNAAPKIAEALKTYKERGKVYGNDGFELNGQMLAALFPDGLTLKTADDFSRFVLFSLCSVKLARYAKNFATGGHQDSIHDLGVYSFILEAFDADHNGK